jgi:hypothetical protein
MLSPTITVDLRSDPSYNLVNVGPPQYLDINSEVLNNAQRAIILNTILEI